MMGPALDIRQKFKKEVSWNRRLRKRVAAIDENCTMSRTGPIVPLTNVVECPPVH